jgi:hypothetical protein
MATEISWCCSVLDGWESAFDHGRMTSDVRDVARRHGSGVEPTRWFAASLSDGRNPDLVAR